MPVPHMPANKQENGKYLDAPPGMSESGISPDMETNRNTGERNVLNSSALP